jgi:2-hydroxy-6-oxonona-2,4-dienedioate hydrolase
MADPKNATPDLIALADRMSRMPGAHRAFVRTLRAIASPFGLRDLDSFAADAATLRQPTLAIWGRQDRIFQGTQSQSVPKLIRSARVETLNACGHYPQWEQPQAFVRLCTEYLS